MNYFVSLRTIKPMLAATGTTVANCGRTDANTYRRVCLSLTTKPCSVNYHHLASKPRFGGLTSVVIKQVTSVSKRAVSNNTASVPSYKKHDHAHVWLWERIFTVGLLGVVPFFIVQPSDAVEFAAALLVTVHSHWGLEAICTDYLRPVVVGNFIPKCIPIIVFVPVVFMFYGIVKSTLSERGIVHVLRQFWQLKTTEQLNGKLEPNV